MSKHLNICELEGRGQKGGEGGEGDQDHGLENLGHQKPGERGRCDEAGSASWGEPGVPRAGQSHRRAPPMGPSPPCPASRVAAERSLALEERQPRCRGSEPAPFQ